MARKRSIETDLVHAGEMEPRVEGAVAMPVFQSATYEYAGEAGSYHDIKYGRLNNTPNHAVLHRKLAVLERGEDALVTASGMAAITSALLTVLGQGGHLLAQSSLYGGTYDFLTRDLAAMGHAFDFVDGNDPDSWEAKLRPNTRAFYVETMTNPLLEVADLAGVARFAREHGVVSVIDNTFASPINFRPLEHGFDLSLHSCTKYMNGHSDVVAGAVVGGRSLVQSITRMLNHLGGCLDPHACFLLHRGIKTLALRMRHQNESALRVAHFLESHDAVTTTNYPGLTSHPQYERASRLFDGFSGMLSFELAGGVAAANRFMRTVTLPRVAPSLGGVETLVTRPATTSHAGMTPSERAAAGIRDGLVRVSIGIEATDDLIDDFEQALRA